MSDDETTPEDDAAVVAALDVDVMCDCHRKTVRALCEALRTMRAVIDPPKMGIEDPISGATCDRVNAAIREVAAALAATVKALQNLTAKGG